MDWIDKLLAGLVVCVATVSLVACGNNADESTDAAVNQNNQAQPVRIVATIGMIGDVVAAVAGDRAEVSTLIAPGVDPHLYNPTRTDTQRLLDAEVIFYNGLMLEGRMTDTLNRAREAGRSVHAVGQLVSQDALLGSDEPDEEFDPHLWMDPARWMRVVEIVRDQLTEHDPEGASDYASNAEAYLAELRELDAYAERVLATVPEGSRVLVTAHDAFGYFGQRFGFEVEGIQGISTESEPGSRDIERLVSMLVERRIGAVFVESTVSDRSISALINGARAQGHEVIIGGELFSDAMGDAGTYEGTYIGMIDHNVTTITRALGGTAPERGMQDRLGQ